MKKKIYFNFIYYVLSVLVHVCQGQRQSFSLSGKATLELQSVLDLFCSTKDRCFHSFTLVATPLPSSQIFFCSARHRACWRISFYLHFERLYFSLNSHAMSHIQNSSKSCRTVKENDANRILWYFLCELEGELHFEKLGPKEDTMRNDWKTSKTLFNVCPMKCPTCCQDFISIIPKLKYTIPNGDMTSGVATITRDNLLLVGYIWIVVSLSSCHLCKTSVDHCTCGWTHYYQHIP